MERFLPSIISAALASLFAVLCPAQSPPGWSFMPKPSWIIINSFNSVPGKDIRQVQHMRLSNNPAGQWSTCLTVGGLPGFLGGDDKSAGLLMGTFDPFKGTFAPNAEARALNSTADDQHLMIDNTGLIAVFDRPTGPFFATRAAVGTAFGSPQAITGLGSLNNVHPAVGKVRGKLKLFYADQSAIRILDFDAKTGRASGTSVVVSLPLQQGAKPIGPSPLFGADGDVEGLFLPEVVKPRVTLGVGDADMTWASDLDPATPPVMMIQRPDYTANGGHAGGFISFSHDIKPNWHLMHSESAILIGDDEVVGANAVADILSYGVNYNHAKSPLATHVFISTGVGPKTKLISLMGWFGLDARLLLPLVSFSNAGAEGRGSASIPIPNSSYFKGKKLAIQAVIVEPTRKMAVLSNTAWLHFR